MAEESLITEEVRQAIGKEADVAAFEIEKGAIRRIAEAVGDSNPLWQDEEYAKKSKYGSIVASPTFVASLRRSDAAAMQLPALPLKRVLNAGNELEFLHHIRPGDTIPARRILADVREQPGSQGKRVFMVMETTYTNQKGEVAIIARQTIMRY